MRHEKLVIGKNNEKVNIIVTFYESYNTVNYKVMLSVCPKGKRLFKFVDCDSYEYRRLSMEDRIEYLNNMYLDFVTEEQILEAKIELWNLLSPNK